MKKISPGMAVALLLGVSLALEMGSMVTDKIYHCPPTEKGSFNRLPPVLGNTNSQRLMLVANSEDRRGMLLLTELKKIFKGRIDYYSYFKEIPADRQWGRVIEMGTFHAKSVPRFISDFPDRGWTDVVASLYNRYALNDAQCFKVASRMPSPFFESKSKFTYFSVPERGELTDSVLSLAKAIQILIY